MTYRITGLSPEPFRHLFGMPDEELKRHGAYRYVADSNSMFPDRVEMRDAEPGEALLLVNYEHQPADTPYRASHAVFILEDAKDAYESIGQIPEVMKCRPLSLRGFGSDGMIIDGDLVDGAQAETLIERFFEDPRIAYIQAHYARRGCYAARIDRA
jgi:hypothetical protein